MPALGAAKKFRSGKIDLVQFQGGLKHYVFFLPPFFVGKEFPRFDRLISGEIG